MEFEKTDGFAELLHRAAQGESTAQELICQKYERQVRIVARVLLGPQLRPHLDTTDVLQSVHRSLLVGLREQKFDISSPDKLVALACTMVRRKVARKWRSTLAVAFDANFQSKMGGDLDGSTSISTTSASRTENRL